MHSVRNELAKLILVGTRITYQANGDAGYYSVPVLSRYGTSIPSAQEEKKRKKYIEILFEKLPGVAP